MPKTERLAGLSAGGKLAGISIIAGLLAGAIALPAAGVVGVAARDAAKTFNTLPVPALGQLPLRSEILDTHGHVLAYYYPGGTAQNPGGTDRVPVSYNQIAPIMREAIVAAEDARFWKHGAFDPRGALRAMLNDLHGNATQGGSDLAQQYVKNALVLTARTPAEQEEATAPDLSRKVIELRIAANVEQELTRQQLLAAYLNAVFFDHEAYGIQVAAERYFSTTAAHLTLTQAAMLAGMVEFPTQYNPTAHPVHTRAQRNRVISSMRQQGYITMATARAAIKTKLGLNMDNQTLQSGCTAPSASRAAFFCQYVLELLQKNPAYATAEHALNNTGGLKIYTTLNPTDQRAAEDAVNFVAPARSQEYNPNHDVDTEVLIQPHTGYVRAIAVNRPYGTDKAAGQSDIDYAVQEEYGGGQGVQTGSSSKLFTLLTALKQNLPFGFNLKIVSPTTLTGYFNCQGQPITTPYPVTNSEGAGKGTFTLYNGTTGSINVFYAELERKVGLCSVVKTAVSLGMTRADGTSLLKPEGNPKVTGLYSADNFPSFTLGSVYVTPLQMADAYATVDAGGVYCKPTAITRIVTSGGAQLPVESPGCHRVLPEQVAYAANDILQGVLTIGTAAGPFARAIGIPAAAKTGTANGGYYAAFAGYTPRLTGYVSVFNPTDPTSGGAMLGGDHSCYREVSGELSCPEQMYGDFAPGATWQYTFLHLLRILGHPSFIAPTDPVFFSLGSGVNSPAPKKPPHHGHGGPGGPGPPTTGPPTPVLPTPGPPPTHPHGH